MGRRTKGREFALRLLYAHDLCGWKTTLVENPPNWWRPDDSLYVGRQPRRFAVQLLKGILSHLPEIDKIIISTAEHWSLERVTPVDRNLLRIGVYELLHEPDIPPQVTINELVELAKAYGDSDSAMFINGILDAVYRSIVKEDKPASAQADVKAEVNAPG